MFGSIGVMELIIIAGVALMVLGPDKFPEFAKMAARLVRDLRSYGNEIQREIAKEIKPVQKELNDLRKIDPEKYIDSLIGDDEDDEDDGTINPEPDPSAEELFGADGVGVDSEERKSSAAAENEDENDRYDTYPYEEEGFEMEEEESPERLDG